MVISRSARSSSLLWLAAPLFTLYLVCAVMARSLAHVDSPELVAAGIAFDLTLTASALVLALTLDDPDRFERCLAAARPAA